LRDYWSYIYFPSATALRPQGLVEWVLICIIDSMYVAYQILI